MGRVIIITRVGVYVSLFCRVCNKFKAIQIVSPWEKMLTIQLSIRIRSGQHDRMITVVRGVRSNVRVWSYRLIDSINSKLVGNTSVVRLRVRI